MILVNGIHPHDVSALDRGLAYGDGLFETLAVVGGNVLNWPRHLARLNDGCIKLNIPPPDFDQTFAEVRKVAVGFERCVVKIIVTRGIGGRGYTPSASTATTRIVACHEWPVGYVERERSGIRICVAEHRLSSNPLLAGLKHLNRLDQVLASIELKERGTAEALMLDVDDRVIEATRCNLFVIQDGVLVTPRVTNCGVRGVMRDIILHLAPRLSLPTEELDLTLDSLRKADELFLCNTIAGIWPVIEIDGSSGQTYAIGNNTRRLQQAIRAGGYH